MSVLLDTNGTLVIDGNVEKVTMPCCPVRQNKYYVHNILCYVTQLRC